MLKKTYTKSELAAYYGVSDTTLRTWMYKNTNLMNELYATGYVDRQNYFTPHQLKIIFIYLGD